MDLLTKYQKEAVEFLLKNGGRGYIALPPGMGKTRIAVYVLKQFNPKKAMIIAPKSAFAVWQKELELFNIDLDKVQVINYEKLLRFFKNNGKRPYTDFLIVDEAHRIKNIKAQTTRILLGYNKYNIPKILLSGTPYKELLDLYTQFALIEPSLFQSWKVFINTFFRIERNIWGGKNYIPLPGAEKRIFNVISSYFFRRSRNDIKDLSKIEVQQYFETPSQYSWKLFIEEKIQELIEEGLSDEEFFERLLEEIQGKFMHLYRLASENNHKKHEYIIDFVNDNPDTVVYTQFVGEAKKIAKATGAYLITGDTKQEEKMQILRKQDKPIVFTSALSEGADLSQYGNLILATIPSSTIKFEQVVGRIDRLSQKNKVLTYIYCFDEYNERMYELLKNRQKSVNLFYYLAENAMKMVRQ